MATREVTTAIRYAIDYTSKGGKEAVALSRDMASSAKTTTTAVDTASKAMQASYVALEKVAVKAQGSVEKAALSASTTVNKALDAQVLKLREAGVSYTAIIAKQGEFQGQVRRLSQHRSSGQARSRSRRCRRRARRPTV